MNEVSEVGKQACQRNRSLMTQASGEEVELSPQFPLNSFIFLHPSLLVPHTSLGWISSQVYQRAQHSSHLFSRVHLPPIRKMGAITTPQYLLLFLVGPVLLIWYILFAAGTVVTFLVLSPLVWFGYSRIHTHIAHLLAGFSTPFPQLHLYSFCFAYPLAYISFFVFHFASSSVRF